MAVDRAAHQRRAEEMGVLLTRNGQIELQISAINSLLKEKKKNLKTLEKLSKQVQKDLTLMSKENKAAIIDLKDVE